MADGDIVTSLDDNSDSEFVGPTLDMINPPSNALQGVVVSGDLASNQSAKPDDSNPYGIVTQADLNASQAKGNPAVPGVATKPNGADAGIGFASLVSNLGAITKQGADIAGKIAPAQTKKILSKVPGQSGTSTVSTASSGPSLGTIALVGGILLGVGVLVAVVKG
jgi:hypothetical protein